MREYGVTLDYVAQLYQQAREAGALPPAKDSSAAAWFEENRDALVRASAQEPRFASKKQYYGTLLARLREAVAAVEETNRVVGLARLVDEARGAGQPTLAVLHRWRQNCLRE